MQVRHAGKLVLMHIRGRLPITSGRPSTEHTVHIRACSGTVSSDATSALGGVVLHNNRAASSARSRSPAQKKSNPPAGSAGGTFATWHHAHCCCEIHPPPPPGQLSEGLVHVSEVKSCHAFHWTGQPDTTKMGL